LLLTTNAGLGQVRITDHKVVTHYKVGCYPSQNFRYLHNKLGRRSLQSFVTHYKISLHSLQSRSLPTTKFRYKASLLDIVTHYKKFVTSITKSVVTHYKVSLQSFVTLYKILLHPSQSWSLPTTKSRYKGFVTFITRSVVTRYKSFCYVDYKVRCYRLQNFVMSHNNRWLIDASLGQVSVIQGVTHYKIPLQNVSL
jgi:hypothetical protein